MINACSAIIEMSDAVCGYLRRNPEESGSRLVADLRMLEASIRPKFQSRNGLNAA